MSSAEEYWRSQALHTAREYESVLQSQRDELESLQRRCSDLLHERSMMKAATAMDVRNFCLHHQAQEQRRLGLTSASAVESIPIYDLQKFLSTYSNGLVPPPENRRKRERTNFIGDAYHYTNGGSGSGVNTATPPHLTDPAASSSSCAGTNPASTHRLYQRMLARQRLTGREGDAEEWMFEHHQEQLNSRSHALSECSSVGGSLEHNNWCKESASHAGNGCGSVAGIPPHPM